MVCITVFLGWIAYLNKSAELQSKYIFFEKFDLTKDEVDAVLALHNAELISGDEARIYLGIGCD
jgi:hypothetical protein